MHRVVMALAVVFLLTVSTAPLCCPDGCTNDHVPASAASTGCALCQSGIAFQDTYVPDSGERVFAFDMSPVLDLFLEAPAASIDHPPRTT